MALEDNTEIFDLENEKNKWNEKVNNAKKEKKNPPERKEQHPVFEEVCKTE